MREAALGRTCIGQPTGRYVESDAKTQNRSWLLASLNGALTP
jgi:hypothetical protein